MVKSRRHLLRVLSGVGAGTLAINNVAATQESGSTGTDEFTTDNNKTPDWYKIGSEDEVKHNPQSSIIRKESDQISSQQQEGVCLGTQYSAFGYSIGINVCHYGGCNFELEGCYLACASGVLDDCEEKIQISVGDSTSPIDATFEGYIFNQDPLVFIIEGEIFWYDPSKGKECKNVETYLDFPPELR